MAKLRETPEGRLLRKIIQHAVDNEPPRVDARGHRQSVGMQAFTVLDTSHDPFRMGTVEPMIRGTWLADKISEFGIAGTVHLRGLHYRLAGAKIKKPDGTTYKNNSADWQW